MNLKTIENKKILIIGLGREGESSFKFLREQFPEKVIGLSDKLTLEELPASIRKLIRKDKKTEIYLGRNYLKAIKKFEIIFKSPGIPRKLLQPHISTQQITSQTEIFLEKYRKQTIGITGTKGKGTTASLIKKILEDNGRDAELIGNIGKPVLDYWKKGDKKKIFVFELSSHQLEGLKISPHIAIFLNIYPDHLDYFKSFKKYFQAKENIAKWQKAGDYFIFNNSFSEIRKLAQKSKAKTIGFTAKKGENYFLCNVLAAKKVASIFKIPKSKVEKSILSWKTFEHRLEFVGKFKEITFYNDSAATIPEATMAALGALENVQTLILGGSGKKSNFEKLAQTIINKKIKTVVLFPKEGKKIWYEIKKRQKDKGLPQHFFVKDMKTAVKICFQKTDKGGVCLLSPACASFSTFKNYQDRGEQFKKYIKEIAKIGKK